MFVRGANEGFSVRGRPSLYFTGGFIIKCLPDEQRPAESQAARNDLVERQRGACGKRNFAGFCRVNQRVGCFSFARHAGPVTRAAFAVL